MSDVLMKIYGFQRLSDNFKVFAGRFHSILSEWACTRGLDIQIKAIFDGVDTVFFVLEPDRSCSTNYFFYLMSSCFRKLVDDELGMVPLLFPSVPGIKGFGVLFRVHNDNSVEKKLSDLLCRNVWRRASTDENELPLPVGLNQFGDDMVIDISRHSCIAFWGGDTMAQEELLVPMFDALIKAEGMSDTEIYFMGRENLWLQNSLSSKKPLRYVATSQFGLDGASLKKAFEKLLSAWNWLKLEADRRRSLIESNGAGDVVEYGKVSRTRMSRILVVLNGLPEANSDDGSVEVSHYREEIADYLVAEWDRVGIHVIYIDFIPDMNDIINRYLLDRIGVGDAGSRIGCIIHNCSLGAAESRKCFGGVEASYVGGNFAIYKSPENEVYGLETMPDR